MIESDASISGKEVPTEDTVLPGIEVELCPLCPSSGPPQPPRSKAKLEANLEVDLVWIACTKCSTWFHSACLYLGDENVQSTIPKDIVKEVEVNRKDEGAWFNWTQWIDKWYCHPCMEKASSPSNPKPPRRPLLSTLKKGVPPFDSTKTKRSASSTLSQGSKSPKKARMTTSNLVCGTDSPVPLPLGGQGGLNLVEIVNEKGNGVDVKSDRKLDGIINGYTNIGIAGGSEEMSHEGRPKRNVRQLDYHNLNNSVATPTSQWLDLIADPGKYGRVILDGEYRSVPGDILKRSWLDSDPDSYSEYPPTLFYGPQRDPIIVRSDNGGFTGMGGQVPGKDLNVQDVARLVGPKRMVDVIDVSSQQSAQWTLQKWADYLLPPSNSTTSSTTPSSSSSAARKKVYNIISLEISDTELAKKVKPPRLVREIDWVDNFWNFGLGGSKGKAKEKEKSTTISEDGILKNGNALVEEDHRENGELKDLSDVKGNAKAPYPKVQLYCLMGMKGAWTDWHVDFAASSVYYTIHTGSKVFYFIRPTTANLKAYAEWSGSYEKQQDTWLPDMCDEVRRVVLNAGDTMILPSGYIHAVYTPMDSIVFGGNFLHSYDIATQLNLRQIEIDTKVPQRFRFPMFERLCWFVADRYVNQLRQFRTYRPRSAMQISTTVHQRVLDQLIHLTNFLLNQISILHNPDKEEKSKKLVWDRIPHEAIKDPEGLARELQWRVLRELGHDNISVASMQSSSVKEDVDGLEKEREKELKRKKGKLGKVFDKKGSSRTWMFDPPKWDQSVTPAQIDITRTKIPRPASHAQGEEKGEEAEQSISSIKQLRRRIREVEGGGLVLEEQEVIFNEKKVVWGLSEEGTVQV
ncbi:uncharacterized protein IL334_005647 [Kwoniella shivajii]|uniref:[histone H3]-dimethyl-L-lysine(36) demethylase n=1 Tax=Kwoniella shivajii TaxID=564305 RepID=A0ABZ1D4D8_9TREE|nr:hypothetical protein IL334_005647 [Kwoniella shivajii]